VFEEGLKSVGGSNNKESDMVAIIDVSAKELRPSAVVDLIREHAENPGPKQILFKVTLGILEQFQTGQPAGIPVSPEEAKIINPESGVKKGHFSA
jgi:hypothetical protein